MAIRSLSAASWGLLAGPPQVIEGMNLTLTTTAALEVTLEADAITVEIDDE